MKKCINKTLILIALVSAQSATTKVKKNTDLKGDEFITYSHNVQDDQRWPMNVNLSGSIRFDSWVDSRQIESFRQDVELLYPKERVPNLSSELTCDECACDINDVPNWGCTPIISRFGMTITGPDDILCKCKTEAFLEADFYGTDNGDAGGFRMRHAFLTFDWDKELKVLLGYTWHPFSNPATIPNTISFNSGEPMVPVSRVPQAKISFSSCKKISINLTAYSELMFTDDGPDGGSRTYLENAGRPGLNLLLLANFPKFLIGIGLDNHVILPRLQTGATPVVPDSHPVSSFIGSVFARALIKKLTIRGQFTIGGNSLFLTQMGGYAVSKVLPNGEQTYTNIKTWGFGFDCDWNLSSRFQPGLYFGRTKNIGAACGSVYLDPNNDNKPIYYGMDSRLDFIYRISPRLWMYFKHVHFGVEFEYTKAGFGPMQRNGKINQVDTAANFRCCTTAIYNF